MIPTVDIVGQHRPIQQEVDAAVCEVMAQGQFLFGPNVRAFEQEVADMLGVASAVSCSSGTAALFLALKALDVGPGDEVITSPFTFFATVEAIMQTGATPVFADIDPVSFNLDPARVEAAITPATRAILPVHLFGLAADMPALATVAERHGLQVVEDCAQSFAAKVGGRATGGWGAAGCFSFFPSKNLGGYGDGGMITTNSEAVVERLRSLCNHGSSAPYCHEEVGYNSRLDEIQAAVLRIKLRRIGDYNAARRRIAARYNEALGELDGIVPPAAGAPDAHVYNQYTIQIPDRDRVARTLQDAGIGCRIYYPRPLHRQPALEALFEGQQFPRADALSERCLSLPIFPEMTDEQIETVVAGVKKAVQQA